MSGYKPREHFEYEFEGDTVTYYLTRLTRQEVMLLTPLFLKVQSDESEEAMTVTNKVIEMLPAHVQDFKGLSDNAGNPISFDVVISDTYFLQLAKDMAGNLMQISWSHKAGDEALKKPESLLVPQSET